MPLVLEPNLADPDRVFTALVDAHRGLDQEASARLNARLVLILANHIGDGATVAEAISRAVAGGTQ